MSALIIVDKSVGPITDFHNFVNALVEDKQLYVMSQRMCRARFVTEHFTEAGFDVHNMCNADGTIDSQIDRIIPDLETIETVVVVGSLQPSTVIAVASIIDAFYGADRTVISYGE